MNVDNRIIQEILEIVSWGIHDDSGDTEIWETRKINDDFEQAVEFIGTTLNEDGEEVELRGKLVLTDVEVG